MASKSIICLSLMFLVFIVLSCNKGLVAAQDLVTKTCMATPFYELCRSTLNSDPRSKTTDVTGLAVITLTALRERSFPALITIHNLFRTGPSQLQGPLKKCDGSYINIVVVDVPRAREALYARKDLKLAENYVADIQTQVKDCRNAFGPGQEAPLAAYNKDVENLALVALAILKTISS